MARKSKAQIRIEQLVQIERHTMPNLYCTVVEVELPDLDHGCSPECACLVKKETDHDK
jgi:hypothetical protein